jgi:hypothetical protein
MFCQKILHRQNLALLGYLLNCVAGVLAMYLVY